MKVVISEHVDLTLVTIKFVVKVILQSDLIDSFNVWRIKVSGGVRNKRIPVLDHNVIFFFKVRFHDNISLIKMMNFLFEYSKNLPRKHSNNIFQKAE